MRDPHAPLNREPILACEPETREMIHALLNPLPVPARGAAMASWLLRDGTGPIYNCRWGDLSAALREAIEQLDPSVALEPEVPRVSG
jgi:hypothetical protein